jgi:hypothetical protein
VNPTLRIVLLVTALGVAVAMCIGLALRGDAIPTRPVAPFDHAEVWRLIDSNGDPNRTMVRVDANAADRLAQLLPGMGQGRQSDEAHAGIAGWAIKFVRTDEQTSSIAIDSTMQYWNEGHGDWPASPTLAALVRSYFDTPTTRDR